MYFSNRIAVCVISFIALATSASGVCAQTSASASVTSASQPVSFGALTPELLADDARLTRQKVRMVEVRAYLSDALKGWSEQSGVALEARDEGADTSGRWRVMIALRDSVSVGHAMDALRSVLSERALVWHWERTGGAPDYRYRLIAPSSAIRQQRQEALRRITQEEFEQQFGISKRALTMTPEEIAQAAANDPTGRLRSMADDPRISEGLVAFVSNVSPEQQQAVLSGQVRQLTLPFSEMNEAGQTFAMNRAKEKVRLNAASGLTLEEAMPTKLIIEYYQAAGKSTPSLMFLVGNERGASGGTYVGGTKLESRRRDALARDILLNGDTKKNTANAAVTDEKIERDPNISSSRSATLIAQLKGRDQEDSLLQLAEAASPRINFMARLGQTIGSSGKQPIYGQTLSWLIDKFYKDSVPSKWNHDILLLQFTGGFAVHDGVENVPPQPLYAFAVGHLDGWVKQKTLPLGDVLTLTQMGSPAQLQTLRNELGMSFYFLENLPPYYPIFSKMASQEPDVRKSLLSRAGARIDSLSPELLAELSIPKGTPGSARVVCGDDLSPQVIGPGMKMYRWVLFSEGEDPTVVSNQLVAPQKGGILKSAAYKVPTPF
jgi:hypothetical protein